MSSQVSVRKKVYLAETWLLIAEICFSAQECDATKDSYDNYSRVQKMPYLIKRKAGESSSPAFPRQGLILLDIRLKLFLIVPRVLLQVFICIDLCSRNWKYIQVIDTCWPKVICRVSIMKPESTVVFSETDHVLATG